MKNSSPWADLQFQQRQHTWQADAIPNPKLGGHSDRNLWTVMVSADGKTLLSGGWNGTTRLWNMASGEQEHAFTATDHSTQGVRFTADGRHFVSNGIHGNGTRVRATDTREVRAELDVAGRAVAGELQQRIEQLRRELKSPAPLARLDGHDGENSPRRLLTHRQLPGHQHDHRRRSHLESQLLPTRAQHDLTAKSLNRSDYHLAPSAALARR